jgi:hypothetical protein
VVNKSIGDAIYKHSKDKNMKTLLTEKNLKILIAVIRLICELYALYHDPSLEKSVKVGITAFELYETVAPSS